MTDSYRYGAGYKMNEEIQSKNESKSVDLKALRELAMAATPGPWKAARINGTSYLETENRLLARLENPDRKDEWCSDFANFDFIAASNPQVILAMIERLEKQEIALERIAESPTWTEKNQFGSLITFTYAATTVHWAKEALGINVKPIEKGKSDE